MHVRQACACKDTLVSTCARASAESKPAKVAGPHTANHGTGRRASPNGDKFVAPTGSPRSTAIEPKDAQRKTGATKIREITFAAIGRRDAPGKTCSRPASRVCDIGAISKPPTNANSAVRRGLCHAEVSMCWHTVSPIIYEMAITDMDRKYDVKVSIDVTPDVDVEKSRAQQRALASTWRCRRPSSRTAAGIGPLSASWTRLASDAVPNDGALQ
eukprot:scaffold14316_cov116-Isochrysis_galbana.AAC.2